MFVGLENAESWDAEELNEQCADWLNELAEFELGLSADPVEDGLDSLHVQMQKARAANDRAASVLSKAIWLREGWKNAHSALKGIVSLERAEILATSEEVKAGKDVKSREALAELELAKTDAFKRFRKAEEMFGIIDGAVKAIEVLWRKFRDYRDDLNFQLKVVAQRILIGEIDVVNSEGFEPSEVKGLKVDSELFEAQEGIEDGIGEIDL